jgi:rhodanese-related sulfurtransferase
MGEQSAVDVVALRVSDGDVIDIDGIRLSAMYTPGHTDDSYSLHLGDRVFTGDTLFIRGTGRTDFQHGDARQQYDSLFNKLLKLPDDTLVYPGHDYKGDTVSTIGEERAHNPRLQVSSADEYAAIMDNLNLPNPKMMDVAVPANVRIGLSQDELLSRGWALTADQVRSATPDSLLFVDVRDVSEGEANGVLAGTVHAPYGDLEPGLEKGGALRELVEASGKQVVFYCAYGERSAMAVELARSAGIADAVHLDQGLVAWRTAGGSLE